MEPVKLTKKVGAGCMTMVAMPRATPMHRTRAPWFNETQFARDTGPRRALPRQVKVSELIVQGIFWGKL